MRRRTVRNCSLIVTAALIASACTSAADVDGADVQDVGWADEIVEGTDAPREPTDAPAEVANRPQIIEFVWRDDTLVLGGSTAAELVDDSTLVVPAGELGTFDGSATDVGFVVAPPTERLPDGLNETVIDVATTGDTVTFTVEPVEFGAPFEQVDIDVTDVPTAASMQVLADTINAVPVGDETSRYRAEVIDVSELTFPDHDPSPVPEPDDTDLDADISGIDAAQVSATSDPAAVTMASWGPDDPAVVAADDGGFENPTPRPGATRYQPETALRLRMQELAVCDGESGWRDGVTVTGDLCDPDRFWLQLEVSLIPSFDFMYDGNWRGRPKEAIVGLNAQTLLEVELRGATRGGSCNEDCQVKIERERDAVQRQINDAGDLLELYNDARLALSLLNTAGIPNVSIGFLWPLQVTYDVEGTFDAAVSGFTGAGITWDRSRSRDDRAQVYTIPFEVDSRATLQVNAAATVTTGPEISVMVARMFGPTISVQGTLDGTGLYRAEQLDSTWQNANWSDAAWNVDYRVEGVVKLRAQDPFIGRVATDWELLRHPFIEGTLIRSAPTHPRLRAERLGNSNEVMMEWTEPAHADRYELFVGATSSACRRAATSGSGAYAYQFASLDTATFTFEPGGSDSARFACLAAIGSGVDGQPVRSRASNVVDLAINPPPPAPVEPEPEPEIERRRDAEFDVDAWLAQPFDLSWSDCNPMRFVGDLDADVLQQRYPGWQPSSVVEIDESGTYNGFLTSLDSLAMADGVVGFVTPKGQGDLTGDGLNEALVMVWCPYGANSSTWELAAFTRDRGGAPQLLGVVLGGFWSSQGGSQLTDDVTLADGGVRVTTQERDGPGWDEGIPTETLTTTYVWDGSSFVRR